jgi:5-methylcytosine-specific restriction endonuclease McrA
MTLSPAQQKEYQRKWCAKNRAEYMAGKSCVVCGTTQNLEVDHIDPSQKVTHRIWSWSAKRRAEELAKCQILCTEHHKEKTRADRPVPEHGTVSRYSGVSKCRCAECREANRIRCAENRARNRQTTYEKAA